MSVYVSDHAVLRYLERVHGVDVEAFRALIAAQAARGASAAAAIGETRFRVRLVHCTLALRGEHVVTVLAPDPDPPGPPPPTRAARLAMEEG